MSIVSIMAAFLEEELREHGIRGLTQRDRETIVISMIERTAELVKRVVLMTPENIHLNWFMYEPILDMSDDHLRALYQDVCNLS
jgi:hypothetical protein